MLNHLSLENFRNHTKFELDLAETTILIGKNGAGKSNVLEAVSLLCFCRSFREDDKKKLVSFGSDFGRVTGDDLEVFIQLAPSYLFRTKCKKIFRRQSEFIGLQKAVVFSPETLLLATGSPKLRRKFLDIMISQRSREYLNALINYEKIRAQKNSLLSAIGEGRAKEAELDFWDNELAKEGDLISSERAKAIAMLNKSLSADYSEIAGKKNLFELNFLQNFSGPLLPELIKNRRKEVLRRVAVTGPHRDDFVFNLNSLNMENYASRGEIRTGILALKIAELNYLFEGEKDQPILMLDDVFSEFDEERRHHLGKLIKSFQTVITTTDREYLSDDLLKSAKVVELK